MSHGAAIRCTLPFPPSGNRYWRHVGARVLVSREALAYREQVARVTRGIRPLAGPVRVSLRVYRPRRTGDLDNCLKVLFDALLGIAFLDDDQVVGIIADRDDDAANPRVEVVALGEAFASPAQVAEHAQRRAEASRKRKATRRKNAQSARLTPALFRRSR